MNKDTTSSLPGLALIGLLITGISGIWVCFSDHEPLGLIASAMSFGVVAHISFK